MTEVYFFLLNIKLTKLFSNKKFFLIFSKKKMTDNRHLISSKTNQKKVQNRAFSNADDEMRSTTLSIVTESNSGHLTSAIVMKSKNLGPNDAYLIAKRIKVNFYSVFNFILVLILTFEFF